MRPVFTRWKHKVPKKSKSSIFGTGKCNGKQVSVSTFTSWLPFACNSACYLVYCGLELFWMENTRSVDQMYCLHCGTLGLGLCIVFFFLPGHHTSSRFFTKAEYVFGHKPAKHYVKEELALEWLGPAEGHALKIHTLCPL